MTNKGNPLKQEELLAIGFEKIPTFTVNNCLIYNLGRGRMLQMGNTGNCNEMLCISQLDDENDKKISDLIVLHNYDYDGFITLEKIKTLIALLTSPQRNQNVEC